MGQGSLNHGLHSVSALQIFLGISPTSYFGPITKAAVKKWQAEHDISAIGYVGPQTRKAMSCGGAALTVLPVSPIPTNASSTAPNDFNFEYVDGWITINTYAGTYIKYEGYGVASTTTS